MCVQFQSALPVSLILRLFRLVKRTDWSRIDEDTVSPSDASYPPESDYFREQIITIEAVASGIILRCPPLLIISGNPAAVGRTQLSSKLTRVSVSFSITDAYRFHDVPPFK